MTIADHWEKTEGQTALENAATAQAAATAAQTFIATCTTAAATAAKAVTGVTGFSLASGACIAVVFSNANTAASPTLNVNAKGAKPIMLNGAAYAYWVAGATVQFVYDGASWQVCNVPLYGATATIGNPASKNIYIDSDSIDFRQATNAVASLGIEPYAGIYNLLALLCGANYDGIKVGGGAYAILDQRVADATYGRYGSYVNAGMHETGAPILTLQAYRGDGSVAHPIDKKAVLDVGIDADGNSYINTTADSFTYNSMYVRGQKTLWEGSWSSGSITVNGLETGQRVDVLADGMVHMYGSVFASQVVAGCCFSAKGIADNNTYLGYYLFSADRSGDTLTMSKCEFYSPAQNIDNTGKPVNGIMLLP